jgi:OFA family oxalate/formate antiporter-like MFS transporter
MKYKITNKWIVVFGALTAQMAIGALYAWSLFNKPISEAFQWNYNDVVTTYAITLVSFALTMILSGRVHLKIGPRYTTLIGAVLYSSGIFLSAFATSPAMLYLTYGVMGGAGVGFIYVCQLSTLVKWFPNNKGAITGIATAFFAIGAIMFKEVITRLLSISDTTVYTSDVVTSTFMTLGIVYAIMTITGALLLDVPEKIENSAKTLEDEGEDFDTKKLLCSPNFYKLLFSDLLALMPGLLIIGLAKDIGTEYIGILDSDLITAAALVGYLAIFNAGGRLVSGRLADKFGALNVYRTMYFVTIISLFFLSFVQVKPVAIVALLFISIGYGSFLSLVPTITGKLFGSKYFSANYSLIFQAYGAAALLGIYIKKNVTFDQAFTIAMVTAAAGLIVAMTIKDNKKNSYKDITDTAAVQQLPHL